jgi:hypothetical protein
MSKAIENLRAAQKEAMAIRPKVGGFLIWLKLSGAQV